MPKPTETRYIGMAVCRQDRAYKDYTSNPIPTFFTISAVPSNVACRRITKTHDVGMGLLVVCPVLPAHCHLVCGFWYCHPYIHPSTLILFFCALFVQQYSNKESCKSYNHNGFQVWRCQGFSYTYFSSL